MYTVEEYRDVLRAVYDMGPEKREKVFGSILSPSDYIEVFPASVLIEKYRAYTAPNTPKVGEYWENNENGETVIVRYVEKNTVRVYYCDGGYNISFPYKYFVSNFAKTEYKSKYLKCLLSEMEEVAKGRINKDGSHKLIKTAEKCDQEAKRLEELSRARTLLKATHDLLETAKKSPYVLDTLSIVVHYDEADCDGNCLKEDIENYFDEYGEDGDTE